MPEAAVDLANKLRGLISHGQLEEALRLFQVHLPDTSELNSLRLLSAQYHRNRQDKINGTLTSEELDRSFNQMTLHLLELIDRMEPSLTIAPTEAPIIEFRTQYQEACALTDLVRGLLSEPSPPYTITDMVQQGSSGHWRKTIIKLLNQLEKIQLIQKSKVDQRTHWSLTEAGKQFFEKLKPGN